VSWNLHFLGTGAAHAVELGSSAVVVERDDRPLLLVDCGPDTLDRYVAAYGAPPPALYVTHVHMDHVAGMERLFFRLWFDEACVVARGYTCMRRSCRGCRAGWPTTRVRWPRAA
jgi:ribonuclease BN (tRNA processing enzyme)